ncbi:MAG TPA: hypothetical protein VH934_04100 [Xanthobacteraceae bacterium]|jgi:hypothetical protein
MIQLLDRWLYDAVTHGWPRPRIDNYIEVLRVDDPESALPNVISRTFQLIDTKASGLLTHTSMMIAALGVAGRLVADSYLEYGVIVAEIMLYLLVAVACLRCMAIFNEHAVAHDPSLVSNAVRDELILRRELYMMCNRAAIFLTVLIFISLPILYFYVP